MADKQKVTIRELTEFLKQDDPETFGSANEKDIYEFAKQDPEISGQFEITDAPGILSIAGKAKDFITKKVPETFSAAVQNPAATIAGVGQGIVKGTTDVLGAAPKLIEKIPGIEPSGSPYSPESTFKKVTDFTGQATRSLAGVNTPEEETAYGAGSTLGGLVAPTGAAAKIAKEVPVAAKTAAPIVKGISGAAKAQAVAAPFTAPLLAEGKPGEAAVAAVGVPAAGVVIKGVAKLAPQAFKALFQNSFEKVAENLNKNAGTAGKTGAVTAEDIKRVIMPGQKIETPADLSAAIDLAWQRNIIKALDDAADKAVSAKYANRAIKPATKYSKIAAFKKQEINLNDVFDKAKIAARDNVGFTTQAPSLKKFLELGNYVDYATGETGKGALPLMKALQMVRSFRSKNAGMMNKPYSELKPEQILDAAFADKLEAEIASKLGVPAESIFNSFNRVEGALSAYREPEVPSKVSKTIVKKVIRHIGGF